jgi:hypothetical protein
MTQHSSIESVDPGRAALREGVALFNRGEYFEAHEVLETPWKRLRGAERDLYQGLIKAAAAFHHASRGKLRSALLLLRRAVAQLGPLDLEAAPLPLDAWLDDLRGCLAVLEREDGSPFDLALVPAIPEVTG